MRTGKVLRAGWVAAAAIAAGCAGHGAAPGQSPERGVAAELGEELDAWHDAAARGDFEAYFARMTDQAVFLGTDASERWAGQAFRDFARPHFDGPTAYGQGAWTYRPLQRHTEHEGGVAWFDEVLLNEKYGRCRGTGVALRGPDGRWRIAHYSLTFLVPNDLAADLTARIKAHEAAPPPGPGEGG